jgi:hypothetical protein
VVWIGWEDALVSMILDDPTVPLELEAHRQPRPSALAPPSSDPELWARVREQARGGTPGSVGEALEKGDLLCSTLALRNVSDLLEVDGGSYDGWRWLATLERRCIKNPDWREKHDLVAQCYCVVEIRNAGDRQALTLPPVGRGRLGSVRAGVELPTACSILGYSQPLLGVDQDLQMVSDGREGLGVPDELLVPLPYLLVDHS